MSTVFDTPRDRHPVGGREAASAVPPRRGLRAWLRSVRVGPAFRGAASDHFDGERFHNGPGAPPARSFGEFWRWHRGRAPTPWPEWLEHGATPALDLPLAHDEIAATFVNHMTVLLQFRGLAVLTDPVWSTRASPLAFAGPRRVHAPGVALEQLPRIDLVLLSHDHYDHLCVDTLVALERAHSPVVVTGLGNRAFLEREGLRHVVELDWWERAQVAGSAVTFTPAQHWSGRGPWHRNRSLWGGFVVERAGRRVFFSGDTGWSPAFGAIRERLGALDIALLPIGAYTPRWFMRVQHMDPADAVRAHLELGARRSIATHFGCFQLTDEGIDQPVQDLAEARRRAGVSAAAFATLVPGETRVYR